MKQFALALSALILFSGIGFGLLHSPSASFAQGLESETPTSTLTPTETLEATQTPTDTATPTFTATATSTLGPCDVAPKAPTLKQPSKGAVFNTQTVILKWEKLPCKPTYTLEIRRNKPAGQIVLTKTFKKKSFTANLTPGRKYAWSVAACNEHGCNISEWRKFKILAPTPTPTLTPTRTRTPTRANTNTPRPPTNTAPTKTPSGGNCSPAYPTVCIPPPPPDLDCGDIPYRNFTVLPPDPHKFDGDHDGVGCES